MKGLSLATLFLLLTACTKGTDPEECRAEYNDILATYQRNVDYATTRFQNNPVAELNNHDSLVVAVNKAVDVANTAAADPSLSDCSGWNKLPHIQ